LKNLILVTNDDGANVSGFGSGSGRSLRFADLLIIAPDRQQAAMSCSWLKGVEVEMAE